MMRAAMPVRCAEAALLDLLDVLRTLVQRVDQLLVPTVLIQIDPMPLRQAVGYLQSSSRAGIMKIVPAGLEVSDVEGHLDLLLRESRLRHGGVGQASPSTDA
jgi:hypothetical protein